MSDFVLKSAQFRREREVAWRELEQLIELAESEGIEKLTQRDLHRLPTLYRGIVSSLSVARAISLDRNLLDYLTNLAARAYVIVYANKRRPAHETASFLLRRFPGTVRWLAGFLAASVACLLAGVACGYLLTLSDVERYYSFVPQSMAQGRDPAASTETLRGVLYEKKAHRMDTLHLFASFLFTHNAKIGMLCFALGAAAGVPVALLLFYNGLTLGAMAALYHTRGLESQFWAWILPHGATELLAVCLCGAAGFVFGAAVIFPGRYPRLTNLALRGRRAGLVVFGAVGMFFVAALIEGYFRQVVYSVPIRLAVAGVTLIAWCAYFMLAGRGDGHEA